MKFPIIPIDATASTVLALIAALPLAVSIFIVVTGGGPARYFAAQSWISLALGSACPCWSHCSWSTFFTAATVPA